MMQCATLEEILARADEYDRNALERLFAEQDELLMMEEDGRLCAVVAVHLDGNEVSSGNMWMSYICEETVLDAFICYAKAHYAGKRLHVCANRDESMAYEVLRYHDFVVDEIVTELDDDEEEYECIECSKQL